MPYKDKEQYNEYMRNYRKNRNVNHKPSKPCKPKNLIIYKNSKMPEDIRQHLIKLLIKANHYRTISQDETKKALDYLYNL